jgi:hypothetical protein
MCLSRRAGDAEKSRAEVDPGPSGAASEGSCGDTTDGWEVDMRWIGKSGKREVWYARPRR